MDNNLEGKCYKTKIAKYFPDTEDLNWQEYYEIAYKTTIDSRTEDFQYRFLNNLSVIMSGSKSGILKRMTGVIFVSRSLRQRCIFSGAVKQ